MSQKALSTSFVSRSLLGSISPDENGLWIADDLLQPQRRLFLSLRLLHLAVMALFCDVGVKMEKALLAYAAFALFSTTVAYSEEPITPDPSIKYLIERLASTNERLVNRKGSPPPSYNKNAQADVWLASMVLLGKGADAIDELVEHFEDERYSYSYNAPSGIFHTTVGGACKIIAKKIVICYDPHIPLVTREQFHVIPWADRTFESWWSSVKHQPLWEIQLAVVRAQLEFQKALVYETAPPIHSMAEKLSRDEFDQRRRTAVAMLERIEKSISESRLPYSKPTMNQYYGAFTYLPWPTPLFNK